jgi:hypothetical protein
MTLSEYINDVKLELTGGILHLELDDKLVGMVVEKALREIQRYFDETRFITVPYSHCIDLDDSEVHRIVSVYRTSADGSTTSGESTVDPMYAQM